jgi:hypothetical protein
MAFVRDGAALTRFSEFGRRAGAALLAAAPPWADIRRPGLASPTWAAAVMFLAPSSRTHAIEQPTGPRILDSPWGSSITALRDIMCLPATPAELPSGGTDRPPSRHVPAWDATARRLRFRDKLCKAFKKPAPAQEKILAAFQEEGWPDAIDDPLDAGKLGRTVESLNDRLQHVKFTLNGAGTGVCWRPD